jgi:hypothetical protein
MAWLSAISRSGTSLIALPSASQKAYTPAIKTGLTSPAGGFNGPVTSAKSEAAAFLAGGESYAAPAQMVGDFLAGRASVGLGNVVLESSSKISLANGISF